MTSAESVDNTPLKGEGGRSATKSAGNHPKGKKDGPPGTLLYLNNNQAKSSQHFQHHSSLGGAEFSPSSAENNIMIDFYSNQSNQGTSKNTQHHLLHPIQEITKGNNVAITTSSAASSQSPDMRSHKLGVAGKKKKK